MRTADKHRVEKAISHLDAAKSILESIKFENLNGLQYDFRMSAYDDLKSTKWHLQDMLNV